MNLIVGLAAVDQATGGKQTRQLANGWMGWESKTLRRLRTAGAGLLVTLAARLAPAEQRPTSAIKPATGAAQG